jgi:hypothetical protein
MAPPDKPSTPADDAEMEPPGLTDPKTGKPVRGADKRAEFERLSRQVPRDPEAERAFIEGKIETVRGDPYLSDAEKERVIEELRSRL